jgi:hypothetical protein
METDSTCCGIIRQLPCSLYFLRLRRGQGTVLCPFYFYDSHLLQSIIVTPASARFMSLLQKSSSFSDLLARRKQLLLMSPAPLNHTSASDDVHIPSCPSQCNSGDRDGSLSLLLSATPPTPSTIFTPAASLCMRLAGSRQIGCSILNNLLKMDKIKRPGVIQSPARQSRLPVVVDGRQHLFV